MTDSEKRQISSQKLIVEFLGTFALTYIGIWAVISFDQNVLTRNGVAMAHAITLTVFMWFSYNISGAHFNSAITVGLLVVNKIDWTTALFYILAQLLGAIVSSGFVFIQISDQVLANIKDKSILGIPVPGSKNYEISGIWGEAIGTFFIMYVYVAMFQDNHRVKDKTIGSAAVGFIYYMCIATLGEICGGGFNPARSLGPAIIEGSMEADLFVLAIGPIIGSILGAIIYSSVFIDMDEDLKEIEQERLEREKLENENREIELH